MFAELLNFEITFETKPALWWILLTWHFLQQNSPK